MRPAQIFVAALGASNYTYAEARWTQGLADWIGCHVNALAFLGGVTRQIVCDNLKAGVTAASRYEPGINRTYQEMAAHYGTAIVPTRVRKPRDKAKVEVAVLVVERWVLARLRHRRFFSLGELNAAIGELIDELNARAMRQLGSSRRALFEAIERAALLPLPAEPYEYAEWRRCRAGPRLPRRGAWALVFRALPADPRGGRGAHHRPHRGDLPSRRPRRRARPQLRCGIGTRRSPSTCRAHTGATPTGRQPGCDARPRRSVPPPPRLVELILSAKPHPEQGFRACLGILRLVRSYGAERVEAACQRGIDIGARTYGSSPRSCATTSIAPIARNRAGRAARPARQHPRRRLLPLRRTTDAHPSHHRSPPRTRPHRHGPRPRRTATTARQRRLSASRIVWPCWSIARCWSATTSA